MWGTTKVLGCFSVDICHSVFFGGWFMKKDVLITLVGTQNNDGEKDKVELITEGSMCKKGDTYYITYKESELTGMDGTTTTVKVQDKKVTILRFGTNNTQLIFEKGKHHVCCYDTMYGAISVGVWAQNVKIDLDDNGGEIFANYSIDVDNNLVGKNDFHMQVKEC